MSDRYPGGIISKTAPTPTGPYENGTAPGIWSLEQQMQYQQQGIWPTAGLQPSYIEDVFSTYLYTGNGSTQTITNGIDLAGDGGLVWIKSRNNAFNNILIDTVRGQNKYVVSNDTSAQGTSDPGTGLTSFTTTGFNLGNSYTGGTNTSGSNNASWTFRKQPKFFDVVTYTGDAVAGRTVAHNLGSVPGCIIVKKTSASGNNWVVYHRSLGATKYIYLNTTAAQGGPFNGFWNDTEPTSTVFSLGINNAVNETSATYVAYLFAHDAGGFGLTGTDNVISCGSFTTDGSGNATVSLGYEPQWVLQKIASGGITSGVDDWKLLDTMRGFTNPSSGDVQLKPNTSDAEQNTSWGVPTATGFTFSGFANATYIYIAIRRGPMKVPTDGTTVFDVGTRSGSGSVAKTNSDILTDLTVIKRYTSASEYWAWTPRLVGNQTLQSNSTDGELSGAMATSAWDTMTGAFCAASNGATNTSTLVDYSFKRAPGFFDVVCYTGDYSGNPEVYHNLGVAPEMILAKNRGGTATQWYIHHTGMGASEEIYFNTGQKSAGALWTRTSTYWKNSSAQYPTGEAHVAYLFATLAGISKVGSYTGTGALQTIDCGFTTSARFILIKRTDATGDWYLYDSANGISSGNDPYLLTNTTGAQVTGTNYVEDTSVGFKVNAAGSTTINVSGGTFIFLAIA